MPRIWGGGLSEGDNPDLEALMIEEDNVADQELVEYEILGLISYHLSLAKRKVLPESESADILNALLQLLGERPASVKGHEDVHSLVDSRINSMSVYGSDLRVFLSRNDQSHLDIRTFYLDSALELAQSLIEVSIAIEKKFRKAAGYMAGYTHYRQAMPVSFRTYFDYLSSVFLDMAEDCLALHTRFSQKSPLGYGSGYGSPVPADLEDVAHALGYNSSYQNPMHGSFYRGMDDGEMGFLLSKIMVGVSRISQDLILYSSDELRFVRIPDGYTTGSSLMPNKRNPDFLEMLQGYAAESISTLQLAQSTLLGKGSGYHREFQISKDRIMASILRALKILRALPPLFEGLELDANRAHALVENPTYATMAAYRQFIQGGRWKDAYRAVGAVLKQGDRVPEYVPDSLGGTGREEISNVMARVQALMAGKKSRRDALIKAAGEFRETHGSRPGEVH